MVLHKMLCQRDFFGKCHMPLLDRKCIAIIGIFHYTGGAKKLLLHHKSYLFCCFLVKSQVTEYFLPFSPISFCKTANMFQYGRKFITFWSPSFWLLSCKVTRTDKIFCLLIRYLYDRKFNTFDLYQSCCLRIKSLVTKKFFHSNFTDKP